MGRSTIIVFGLAGVVALGSAIITVIYSPRLPKRSLLTIVASGIALIIFVSTRHIQLLSHRNPKRSARITSTNPQNDIQRPPMDYNLFVLGSGGHTKEMLMMMDDSFCDFSHFHRRYLISSGDSMSENHLHDYEDSLMSLCKSRKTSPGTYDKRIVTRARRVHQPLWSTPWTALLSIVDIFPALLVPPENEVGKELRYPSRVFSNGPATGFFVALAVHMLKMAYIVPESCMKVIYIESWARISTLSLTGKLLLFTGIADVFVTQHQEVATRYGVQNAGEIVFNSRRLDDIEPSSVKC
ncbi:glycosyltransferase family 1 protein [Trichoderma barbatum]